MAERTKYEDKFLKSNRTFPVGNTILLVIIVVIQIILVVVAALYQPKPQDLIHKYEVTVEPLADGSLDIECSFLWEALDTSEELTWVEIGMPNDNFVVYSDSVSDNISRYETCDEDDYVSLQLDFQKPYVGGDMIAFSFKINQRDMLCKNEKGYFYEFVPGWFNAIQVKEYVFTWVMNDGEDIVHQGSLDYGGFDKMFIQYDLDSFAGCNTVEYQPFDDEGACNDLEDNKFGVIMICAIVILVLIIAEVYIVDSYVSYNRGRGFLTGYGHHVHVYGRSNPRYIKERDKHTASHSGHGGRSGGCACACACACAGGGRAGCSQKDTFENKSN